MKKVDRRITKTRDSIQKSFSDLISKKAYREITVSELARQANIDRKTFYLHYDSIDSLAAEMEEALVKKLVLVLEQEHFFDSEMNIASFYSTLDNVMQSDIKFYTCLACSPSYTLLMRQVKNILKKELFKKLTIRPTADPEELNFYLEFFTSGMVSTYAEWLRSECKIEQSQLTHIIGNAVYYGASQIMSQSEPVATDKVCK